ncbi:MAG: glycosyltransferase family 4 protein [Candidatus Eisenbacteria sp.]|nr:glycosyltransferase family 4 protein [Candidatus Eisenbacteria bacterium]
MTDLQGTATPAVATQRHKAEPLRVGYVLKMFPRFSETFILNEILELERRGVQVAIFSMKTPNERVRQPGVARVQGAVRVIPAAGLRCGGIYLLAHLSCLLRHPRRYAKTLCFVHRRRTRAAWNKFLVAPYVARQARIARLEHLHAHFASGPARLAKLVSMLSGIPFSFTAHAKDLFWAGHNHGKNHKLKKRVRMASFVITISAFNRRFVQSLNFKVPRRRVLTIYNGLDLDAWAWQRPDGRPRSVAPHEPPLILAVGRLVSKKGFHVLAGACRLLQAEGLHFRTVIAGEGPERERLEKLIRKHALQDVLDLAGSVPQDRLQQEYYRRSTMLVQPSVIDVDGDMDGIPTVILEALAVGLPVVATDVSGIAEAVIDGQTGLLVRPRDTPALAAAMRRLLADPALAADLSAGGRRLAEHRFNLKNNAKILVHLMENSARGTVRWSMQKIHERSGAGPLPAHGQEAGGPATGGRLRREEEIRL